MGYCYDSQGRLSCDRCDDAVGRKRTCTAKVLGSSHRTMDHKRHSLPYCPAPALCDKCFAIEGGSKAIHARCQKPAAVSQAREDAEQLIMDAGGHLLASASGDWAEGVPPEHCRVTFTNNSGEEKQVIMLASKYNQRGEPYTLDMALSMGAKEVT